jgi:hypothetical protein
LGTGGVSRRWSLRSRVAAREPLPVDVYLIRASVKERPDGDAVPDLAPSGVPDPDLEHVVGEFLEAVLVEEGAVPFESVVCCFACELVEFLAGEAVLLERLRGRSRAVSRRGSA